MATRLVLLIAEIKEVETEGDVQDRLDAFRNTIDPDNVFQITLVRTCGSDLKKFHPDETSPWHIPSIEGTLD